MGYDIDTIHSQMLEEVSDQYQKSIGYPLWDLTRAFALAVQSLSGDLATAQAAADVDNMIGEELTKWCRQRKGITRKAATKAAGTVTIVAGAGNIAVGDLFESVGGVQFAATEAKAVVADATVAVEAVIAGSAGNAPSGTVTRLPIGIAGIATVTNATPMTGGYDAESDTALRERYYNALRAPIASGNKAFYRAEAEKVEGVGRAKVFALANGANTVEVCVIDDDMQPPGAALVAAVQAAIDPESAGTGEGAAPIGAHCTVTAATAKTINAACTVTLVSGYEAADVLAEIESAIQAYLRSIAFVSASASYAKIANCIHDAQGVEDYAGLTVNSGTANIAIGDRETPVLGVVTIA